MTDKQKEAAKVEREVRNNRVEQGQQAEVSENARHMSQLRQERENARVAADKAKLEEGANTSLLNIGVGSQSSMADYIAVHESSEVPLVEISHPQADGNVYQGRYSGIRTVKGAPRAMWSDGRHT